MIRVLRPWFNNTSKRLVKSPKIYLRDSGLFHRLQLIDTPEHLESHPKLGASREGFAINQFIIKPQASMEKHRRSREDPTETLLSADAFNSPDGEKTKGTSTIRMF